MKILLHLSTSWQGINRSSTDWEMASHDETFVHASNVDRISGIDISLPILNSGELYVTNLANHLWTCPFFFGIRDCFEGMN
jgi:hypothetical protein